MAKKNKSGNPAINFETKSVSRFIEDYCPIELTADLWEEITGKDLETGESTVGQYCDPRYQRRYGAWDTKRKCGYIRSIFENRIYTPIVLCPFGLNTPENNSGVASCLDGQHRSRVIAEFVSNRFGFTGTYIVDGKEYSHVNCLFSNLTDRERKLFLGHSNITVGLVSPNQVDLRQCFISINDGEALNEQEKRNAIDCWMAEWSRKMGTKHQDLWGQISGVSTKISRMADLEMVSKVLMFLENHNEDKTVMLDSETITSFYNKRKGETKISDYVDKCLLASLHTTAQCHKRNKNSKLKMYQFWFYSTLHFNIWKNTDVDVDNLDHEQFWEWCLRKFAEIEKDSQTKFHPTLEKYEKNEITRDEYLTAKNQTFHANVNRVHTAAAQKIWFELISEEWDGNWNACHSEFISDTQPSELKEVV